jgi:hypothetical protein
MSRQTASHPPPRYVVAPAATSPAAPPPPAPSSDRAAPQALAPGRRRPAASAGRARPPPSPPIDAPCTRCLRHGDPIHARKGLTCEGGEAPAAAAASCSISASRSGREPPGATSAVPRPPRSATPRCCRAARAEPAGPRGYQSECEAIGAPCTRCLRHRDPIHATRGGKGAHRPPPFAGAASCARPWRGSFVIRTGVASVKLSHNMDRSQD